MSTSQSLSSLIPMATSLLGSGKGGSSGTEGIGALLGALGGKAGAQAGAQGALQGVAQGSGQIDLMNLIQQNPELFDRILQQGNKIFTEGAKGVKGGVKYLANRLIPNKNIQDQIALKRLENERMALDLENQRIRETENKIKMRGQMDKKKSDCQRCSDLKQKEMVSEEEQMERQRVCRSCEEICQLLESNPELKDMSLEALCRAYSTMMM